MRVEDADSKSSERFTPYVGSSPTSGTVIPQAANLALTLSFIFHVAVHGHYLRIRLRSLPLGN